MMRFLDEKAGKTSVQLEALINKDELALNNFYVKFCDYKKISYNNNEKPTVRFETNCRFLVLKTAKICLNDKKIEKKQKKFKKGVDKTEKRWYTNKAVGDEDNKTSGRRRDEH